MDRRKSIKALAMSVVAPGVLLDGTCLTLGEVNLGGKVFNNHADTQSFASSWEQWPDMNWAGPEFWGNRLQDWRIWDGKIECLVRESNRTLHCLTTQLTSRPEEFETSVTVHLLGNESEGITDNYSGFRLGAKATGRFDDYRCAAVFGEGLDAGITTSGNLFIGTEKSPKQINPKETVRLVLQAVPAGTTYRIKLSALTSNNKHLGEFTVDNIPLKQLTGNIALVQHYAKEANSNLGVSADGTPLEKSTGAPESDSDGGKKNGENPSVRFAAWKIAGPKVYQNPAQTFGPICFAQYTLHKKTLKLTAQLAPIESIAGHKVALQVKQNNDWKTVQESPVDLLGRSAHFRLENWTNTTTPYRIKLDLPLKSGVREYVYEGTIAAEPVTSEKLKVAVFSCNGDYGFPDTEVAPNVEMHNPDMAVFLGDQFYESTGGFRIQTFPLEKACLDYLRKWYMFGWSYREVFRHIPCAIIPDDHDVYHGNVWGEGGKHAPSDEGWGSVAQDKGGFKMPAAWVNMVQRTQTGHLPDPYDPTPVKQGIGVYYTVWNYGGVSFAILEDRKFKSAPKNVLPEEAMVQNGFIQNRDFDIKKHRDIDAELLGERQLSFLNNWVSDWGEGIVMKAVLSQTNFCNAATLPEGSITDSVTGKLSIPEPEEYVKGDTPTGNMDSNGWPQKGRDEVLKILRKSFVFHIAGDQHLASIVHYGVDAFGDAGFAFAGPALNNIHARRWWPPTSNHQPLPGQPLYTGNFFDGFGNRMTVHAVANPHKTGIKPAIVYDRATGYGIVTFDKGKRTISIECWPRFVNPQENPVGQYKGWPITIDQEENYGRKAEAWLPEIKVIGLKNPVVEVIDESNDELLYSIPLRGNRFKPKVFAKGSYTIRVSQPGTSMMKERKNVRAKQKNSKTMLLSV